MVKKSLILIALIFCATAAYSQEKYIGNIMSTGADEHYTIVVETVAKKLYLLQVDDWNQKIVDSADILTGREGGSKEIQNDGKTPEGIYYLIDYMTDKEMLRKFGDIGARYGIAAYPTNYPNPIDKIFKRTGYGIWLHGLNPGNHKPATEGCVALENEDLQRMMPKLSVGMPIVIINEALFMNGSEYGAQREAHLNALGAFIEAWNSSDYDKFKSFVHEQYSSYAAANAKTYLANKKALMESYPERRIVMENVNIYRQNDVTLVYDFDQFYCADNIISYGNKRLYLINENGQDKIISEQMFAKPVRDYLNGWIYAFLDNWSTAWKWGDIKLYMQYYDKNFPNRSGWESGKADTFSKAGVIDVKISNVSWELMGGNDIRVRFTQEYSSNTTYDKGIKTLVISGCPDGSGGGFTILSESWSAN